MNPMEDPSECIDANNQTLNGIEAEVHSPIQEQHVDFLLEEEFASNPEFLKFFIRAAEASRPVGETAERSRFSEPCDVWECDAVRSVTTSAGESDVLVVYRSNDQKHPRVAILIENKIGAGFQSDQAHRYQVRGREGIPRNWDAFWTCLVCPEKYIKGFAGFDSRVSLEMLHPFFNRVSDQRSQFKAGVIERAFHSFDSHGPRNVDPVMTKFREYYAEQAAEYFQRIPDPIEWDPPRDAWYDDSWFTFRSSIMPKGIVVIHKAKPGVVHFSCSKNAKERLDQILEGCDHPKAIEAVKKHNRFELNVPPITEFNDPSQHRRALLSVFGSVETLVQIMTKETRHNSEFRAADPVAIEPQLAVLPPLQAMLHGLIRVRIFEFKADPTLVLPDLAAMVAEGKNDLWFSVPGMAGGFQIRLVKNSNDETMILAESGSRIWDGHMRHKITLFEIRSEPYDYMAEPLFDEWVASQLSA